MSEPLVTHVPGDSGQVEAVARWIRRAEREGVAPAGELAADARREAGDLWDSDAGSSYRAEVRSLHDGVEGLRPTFIRSAEIVSDYAIELDSVQRAMERIRERARAGGLEVGPYHVAAPAEPMPLSEEVMVYGDSPENPYRSEYLAYREAQEKVRLFGELRGDAQRIRDAFDQYLEAHLGPLTEHLGVDHLVGWRGDIGPLGRVAVGLPEHLVKDSLGAAKGIPDIPKHLFRVADTGYTLIDGARQSGQSGDPTPIAEAVASETTSRGVDAAQELGKKTPWRIGLGALAKATADAGTGAAVDELVDTPLPPAPVREGSPSVPAARPPAADQSDRSG